MKSLFFTILIFAAAFAAYDYFGAPPGAKVIFTDLNKGVADPNAAAAPATTASGLEVPPIPQDTPAPPAATTPMASAETTPSPTAPVTETPPPVVQATGFVEPKYETLEQLSKTWTFIPPTAFPRQVHLKKNATFKMSVGGTVISAGKEVTALGFRDGQLALTPAAGSTARAILPLDDTDLKNVLEENYVRWKAIRSAALKKAFETRMLAAKNTPAPSPGTDPATPPERGSDGAYPLLVAHLNSGEISEIKAKNIKKWYEPETMMWEGKPAWAVKIDFEAETIFGLQPVQAQAIVASGRVKGWYYTGSGEQVP
jgi:hypothetical protein